VAQETRAAAYVNKHVETAAAPDALMYFPPVYYFHAALMIFAVAESAVQFAAERTLWARGFSLAAVGLGAWSVFYFIRWWPGRVRFSIERNRVIWQAALARG
jgi:hypothetical protein